VASTGLQRRSLQVSALGDVVSKHSDASLLTACIRQWSHLRRQQNHQESVQRLVTNLRRKHWCAVLLLCIQLAAHKDAIGLHACLASWRGLTSKGSLGLSYWQSRTHKCEARHRLVTETTEMLWGEGQDANYSRMILTGWNRIVQLNRKHRAQTSLQSCSLHMLAASVDDQLAVLFLFLFTRWCAIARTASEQADTARAIEDWCAEGVKHGRTRRQSKLDACREGSAKANLAALCRMLITLWRKQVHEDIQERQRGSNDVNFVAGVLETMARRQSLQTRGNVFNGWARHTLKDNYLRVSSSEISAQHKLARRQWFLEKVFVAWDHDVVQQVVMFFFYSWIYGRQATRKISK